MFNFQGLLSTARGWGWPGAAWADAFGSYGRATPREMTEAELGAVIDTLVRDRQTLRDALGAIERAQFIDEAHSIADRALKATKR